MLLKYKEENSGNVAMMMALSALMLIGGVGAAIDIRGASNLRSSYQDIADSAVLAAARSRDRTPAAWKDVALKTVTEINSTGTNPDVDTVVTEDPDLITVTLAGTYQNVFMGMFGKKSVDVTAVAQSTIEVSELADIVLVLDTTRSMSYQNRLTSLRTAANTFVNVLDQLDADDRVRISIVPFGEYMNVGLSQRGEDWLDVPADYTETFPTTCSMQRGPMTGQTCAAGVTQPTPGRAAQPAQPARPAEFGTCNDDGVSYSCQTRGPQAAVPAQPAVPPSPGGQPTTVCTPTYGPDQNVCNTPTPKQHTWNGCVGSRRNNSNTDADYSVGEPRVPGFLDLNCGDSILPLTNDFTAVRNKINNLSLHGETYTAQGLIWGHRILDFNAPFPLTRRDSAGNPPRRIMVFMTDGFNTVSRVGERHTGTDRDDADRLSKQICDKIHDDDIEAYTVSFRVTDTNARNLIQDCASIPGNYYQASNNAALITTFEDIAYSLLSPRLTN